MKNNTTQPRLRKHQFITINTGAIYNFYLLVLKHTQKNGFQEIQLYTHSLFFELRVCYPFQYLSSPSLSIFQLNVVLQCF